MVSTSMFDPSKYVNFSRSRAGSTDVDDFSSCEREGLFII